MTFDLVQICAVGTLFSSWYQWYQWYSSFPARYNFCYINKSTSLGHHGRKYTMARVLYDNDSFGPATVPPATSSLLSWACNRSPHDLPGNDSQMLLAWVSGTSITTFQDAPREGIFPQKIEALPMPPSKKKRTRSTTDVCAACRLSKVRCEEERPCTRCVKHNWQDSCVSWRLVDEPADNKSKVQASVSSSTTDAQKLDSELTKHESPLKERRAVPLDSSRSAPKSPSSSSSTTSTVSSASLVHSSATSLAAGGTLSTLRASVDAASLPSNSFNSNAACEGPFHLQGSGSFKAVGSGNHRRNTVQGSCSFSWEGCSSESSGSASTIDEDEDENTFWDQLYAPPLPASHAGQWSVFPVMPGDDIDSYHGIN